MRPELFDWLRDHGIEPAGPEFLKFNVIDIAKFEIEFGVPTASPVSGDNPGSRRRAPRLYDANADLIDWTKKRIHFSDKYPDQTLDAEIAQGASGAIFVDIHGVDPG